MSSRWGSLLSGAVAGLESKLDTILADDSEASAKARAAEQKAKEEAAEKARLQALQAESGRSRPNSRLQDRLAKAVNKGADRSSSAPRASLDAPSRPGTPASKITSEITSTTRESTESKRPDTGRETTRSSEDVPSQEAHSGVSSTPQDSKELATPQETPQPVVSEQPSPFSIPEIVMTPETEAARPSIDSLPSRSSLDAQPPSSAVVDATIPRDPSAAMAELESLRTVHEQAFAEHREEMHSHLERIDTLQSKVMYLSQQLASQAKATASETKDVLEKKLAEKDGQIAALMEEGQKLSKTELKHMNAIKKMRAKSAETEKQITTLTLNLSKAEKRADEATERAKRAEAAERAAQDKLKIVTKIEKDLDIIRAEREEAGLTITELRRQLSDAVSRVEDAEKRVQTGALEAEKRVTASLKEDIENLRIEKKLTEDRAKRELQEAKEKASRDQEKAKVAELELKGEIANLETKLELLRSRSEEVSSSATSDSQAKLLRQIETLQSQYTLASENWQGIESTLNSRVAALEREREDFAKREAEARRKAKEGNSKARRLEDEFETLNDQLRTLEQDLAEQRELTTKLQTKLTQAESALEDARAKLENERKVWEAELQQRIDEEKTKWRLENPANNNMPPESAFLRIDSLSSLSNRRHSPDPLGYQHGRRPFNRTISSELPLSPMDRMIEERRPSSGRKVTGPVRTPEIGTPVRQDSFPNSLSNVNNGLPTSHTPSINTFDHEDAFENMSSPHRTINDMISNSTVGAGPSVQLVERMSAAVRRLESEKANWKEEIARANAQRDEARDEVVALMREVEEKRAADRRIDTLERELRENQERLETTLEMLGEKSEEVEELKADVADIKEMYRELVLERANDKSNGQSR